MYNTLDEMHNNAMAMGNMTWEYMQKQIHRVPDTTVVDRVQYILSQCKGKRVLDIGCASGNLHGYITEVAEKAYGIDYAHCDVPNFYQVDLDRIDGLPDIDVDVIICGEVLEHLSNPGNFLAALHAAYHNVPLIITVPNAHGMGSYNSLRKGIENVNLDYVAWYSYTTLKTLVTRYGYKIEEWYWYNGEPYFAEGLIMKVRGG